MDTLVYAPKHASLTRYDPAFIDPLVRSGDFAAAVSEPVEQVYLLKLFTPEFCRLLVEEAEHHTGWVTRADVLDHPYASDDDVKNYCFSDTTLHLEKLGLSPMYDEVVQRHLQPLLSHLWPIFRIQKVNPPYVLKYEPSVVPGMGLHYDLETVAMVVYLNDAYEGGGTAFPRWGYSTGKQPVGTVCLFPGGLSHVHEGRPLTSGVRYLMCGAFF